MSGLPTFCVERKRLLDEYTVAARVYSSAVARLKGLRMVEFRESCERATVLREACQRARQELEDHQAKHGCGM